MSAGWVGGKILCDDQRQKSHRNSLIYESDYHVLSPPCAKFGAHSAQSTNLRVVGECRKRLKPEKLTHPHHKSIFHSRERMLHLEMKIRFSRSCRKIFCLLSLSNFLTSSTLCCAFIFHAGQRSIFDCFRLIFSVHCVVRQRKCAERKFCCENKIKILNSQNIRKKENHI
jgi:hypothetical protein